MKRTLLLLLVLGAICLAAWIVWPRATRYITGEPFTPTQQPGLVIATSDYVLSGPLTHDNLTIYLIRGMATDGGRSFVTLQEALESGEAVVHETGNVGKLEIENKSNAHELFIQSGDIVKGGKQDRTFPYDTVVPISSGRIPVDSFCVEQGRWSAREKEPSGYFSSSSSNLSTNALKQAAYAPGESSQGEVWRNVALTQSRLEKKIGVTVKAKSSESSLQLTLESPAVAAAIAPYQDAIKSAPDAHQEVLGFIAVINGKVVSADVYTSPSLFRKLWPKLLLGTAVEAFLDAEPGQAIHPVTESSVRAYLADAEIGTPCGENVTARTYVLTRRAAHALLIESCDRPHANVVLHRNYLSRLAEKK